MNCGRWPPNTTSRIRFALLAMLSEEITCGADVHTVLALMRVWDIMALFVIEELIGGVGDKWALGTGCHC